MPLFGPPDVEKLKAKGNVKGLIKALQYPKDWRIREYAARALGELKSKEAVPLLLKIGYDDYAEATRETAVKALVEIGEPCLDQLIEGMSEFGLRAVAARVMTELGNVAVPRLADVLLKGWFPAASQEAAKALKKINTPEAIEVLTGAMFSLDASARKAAGSVLAEIGEPVRPLLVAATNESGTVPVEVKQLLEQLEKNAPRPKKKKRQSASEKK